MSTINHVPVNSELSVSLKSFFLCTLYENSHYSLFRKFPSSDRAHSEPICDVSQKLITASILRLFQLWLCVFILSLAEHWHRWNRDGLFSHGCTHSMDTSMSNRFYFDGVFYWKKNWWMCFLKRIWQNNRLLHTPIYKIKPVIKKHLWLSEMKTFCKCN